MLNYIWLGLMVLAVVIAGCTDNLKAVADKSFEMAEFAVMKTALPLVGIMALWLGIMRLAERAGLVAALARALRPLMRWLYPDVPPSIRRWARSCSTWPPICSASATPPRRWACAR